MSLRSAARGIVLVVAGAAVATAVATMLSPSLRRTALGLVRRGADAEPQQPTHIVLPDRLPAAAWGTQDDDAVETDSLDAGVALTGA